MITMTNEARAALLNYTRRYTIQLSAETWNNGTVTIVATTPELLGAVGSGDSAYDAILDLMYVREQIILNRLNNMLDVP